MIDCCQDMATGKAELRKAKYGSKGLIATALLFSVFVNLLMLTGPLFMLQVYDRVLNTRSEETLVALSILVTGLFLLMAILDYARGRIVARVGAGLQEKLDARVFAVAMNRANISDDPLDAGNGLRYVDALRSFYASPAILAVLDLPWAPFFFAAIFVFHPSLGWLSVGGGSALVALAVANQTITFRKDTEAQSSSVDAHSFAAEVHAADEIVRSQGMQQAVSGRLLRKRAKALSQSMFASDWTGSFSSLIKASRLFLQSAMLGVGAFLVLKGEMTAGAMIAGSILLGRALAPVEQLIVQWPILQRARTGWVALARILAGIPKEVPKVRLPRPSASLSLSAVSVNLPGQAEPVLKNVSFRLEPGQAIGVIGANGSGKSTLARVIVGVLPVSAGVVRLGGAALGQYRSEDLGRHIGYLPQSVVFFKGTIAENIARMSLEPDPAAVVQAAIKANAHEVITRLPNGYNTCIEGSRNYLSGGEIQRIALARALYGDPVVLVMDEPNSALDVDGSSALNACVRRFKSAGKSVVIMTHHPAAIAVCDRLMVLEKGAVTACGRAEDIVAGKFRNLAVSAVGNEIGLAAE